MKKTQFLPVLAVIPCLLGQRVLAVSIDVNQTFDYTSTTPAANTLINWSDLTWNTTPTWGAGVTAGIPNGSGLTSLGRTYNVNVSGLTLKQLQLYNQDATVLQGGTITWDSGAAGVQCDLGRNRHTMADYYAGRNFTVSPDFVLNSDLRVTNWVESRTTTYNSNTSGVGKLTLRIVPWGGGNTCALNIGGTAANTHEGGTTLTMGSATMNGTINKAEAFGTGVLTLNGAGLINVNLNGKSQTVAGLASAGTGAHVLGNATAAAAATLTLKLKDGATTTYGKSLGSASATYGNNLALVVDKATGATGTGLQVLSGTNTFTGSTTVSGGTLRLLGAQALSGSSAVTVGPDASLHYVPSGDTQLALPGTLTLTGGTSTVVGTAVGSTATSAAIAATGVASATGAIKLDLGAVAGVSPAPGTYTLISGGAGSTLDGGTYSLGTVWNATNFTVNTPVGTAEAVTAELVAATPLATAYWKGGFAGHENAWAVSNGTTAGNWTTDAAGTTGTGLVPGSSTDVVISATGAVNQGSMVLGASSTIQSLQVADSSTVTLGADGNTLTITPAVSSAGIDVQSGAGAVSLATPVVLGADQTWTNASSNPLTVSGVVSGSSALTKAGSGALVLSGSSANTFSGVLTLASGTLHINKGGALGTTAGGLVIKGGTVIDNTSGGALISTDDPLTIDGDFTFAGSNDLDMGNGNVSLGTEAGTTRTITVTAGELTIGGDVANGTTATALTKTGAGTLTLYGFSTLTGPVTVEMGTLKMNGTIDNSSGFVVKTGATLNTGAVPYSLLGTQSLAGTGTVVGDIIGTASSVISPGLSTGILSVTGNVSIASSLAIEIDDTQTPTCDTLAVSGTLDITGGTLNLTVTGTPGQGAYVIATYGALTGTFATINGMPGGYEIDYAYSGNQIAIKQSGADTFPPNWVATWPQVDTATTTSFTVRAKTDENGNAYYVVLPDGAGAPSAAQVKAGTDAADVPVAAPLSGTLALTANTEATASVTGLTPGTNYDVYFVAEDAVPNVQLATVKVDASTLTVYQGWIAGYYPGETNPAIIGSGADPDLDGNPNFLEFALGGAPNNPADGPKIFSLAADGSVDVDANKELLLTIAVLSGTPGFSGSPSPTATKDQAVYTVYGSANLNDAFPLVVTPVDAVAPPAPNATPPSGYEWRTFSLDASNGLPSKGFLRVGVGGP